MIYSHLLFDLDGTLTDSSPGIVNSIRFALDKMGISEEDDEKLKGFVGPGLKYTFRRHYFHQEEEVEQAVKHYRSYFSTKGIFENQLYPEVKEMLGDLKEQGYHIALATAKPTYFANIILNHFEIRSYFDVVVGSHLNGNRTDKKEIIHEVKDQFGLPDAAKCLMVGDRDYDVLGANHHGIQSAGACYGYGSREELVAAGVDFLIENPNEILKILEVREVSEKIKSIY